MEEELVDKLDKGLKLYYESLNKNNYMNPDGIGKFKAFIEDNEYDDDDVQDELNLEDVKECTLTEFDNDIDGKTMFPLSPPILDETARNEEIMRILKIIAEKGQYDSTEHQIVTEVTEEEKLYFLQMADNITNQEIDKAILKYSNQMNCFADNFDKDEGLKYFLGVSEKENIPFITYMVDSYTKDRAKYYIEKGKKAMKVSEWSLESGYMEKLKQKSPKTRTLLESAIKGYSNRIMARLQFSATTKIEDSIRGICEYIASVPAFIQKIMEQQLAVPPFQVELLIAVKATASTVADNNDNINNNDDDDDDDDDDDNKYDEPQDIQLDHNTDHIGHVQDKLAKYGATYFPEDNWDIDEIQQSINAISRFLQQRYHGFRDVLLEYHKNKKKDGNHDGDDAKKDNKYKPRKFNAKTYPQNMRFDIFVDRRKNKPTKVANKGNKDDDKKNDDEKEEDRDQITYFQPPDFCNFISMDHVPEIGFELIRKCIIPSKEGNITALDAMCGQLLTFMFNIEQKDEIKCYIVWNGQTMRFHGEHMLSVLPHLFEENMENIQFVHGEQIKTVMRNFNAATPDIKFDKFYKTLQSFK